MAVDTAGQARTPLDLKSAQLSVVAMVLKTVDVAAVAAELAARSADDPEFFDNDPVLIDLSAVQAEEQPIDFAALVQLLRSHRTQPVAVRGDRGSEGGRYRRRAAFGFRGGLGDQRDLRTARCPGGHPRVGECLGQRRAASRRADHSG